MGGPEVEGRSILMSPFPGSAGPHLFTGRTYTLTDEGGDPSEYYRLVRKTADACLRLVPGAGRLLRAVREASTWKGRLPWSMGRGRDMKKVLVAVDSALGSYLTGVEEHLRTLSPAHLFDTTLRTTRRQHLLYMMEIELNNRLARAAFLEAPYRMALIAHCLKDFREDCRAVNGDIEMLCSRCDGGCLVRLASELLERFGVEPYISASMDHRGLFQGLMARHPGLGVLGIACIPELVMGLRLCEELGLPAVGVPLDANRCSRWMGQCLETTVSLTELDRLLGGTGDWN
ncbi:MAG: DUF116 domain-containing protein [bacterium]|nr:MAG: DUF116 domain-containing protein [bacterium]